MPLGFWSAYVCIFGPYTYALIFIFYLFKTLFNLHSNFRSCVCVCVCAKIGKREFARGKATSLGSFFFARFLPFHLRRKMKLCYKDRKWRCSIWALLDREIVSLWLCKLKIDPLSKICHNGISSRGYLWKIFDIKLYLKSYIWTANYLYKRALNFICSELLQVCV